MNFVQRKNPFIQLGKKLSSLSKQEELDLIHNVSASNPWFTELNVRFALNGIVKMLDEKDIEQWLGNYQLPIIDYQKKIGVIMAGNIPAVGFHDMMCVLLSGHVLQAKLSKDDAIFPKILTQLLIEIEPKFKPNIIFTDQMKGIDALIATGSDNSARYFDYYFSKIPRIIRRNRTSIAILDGTETDEDMKLLGKDVFTYFGLGCRNVSKLFVPSEYDFTKLFEAIFEYGHVINSNKYCNNYEYHRAINLMNQTQFLDNNFLIIKESKDLVSPVGSLYYQPYKQIDIVLDYIIQHQDKLQCIVSKSAKGKEVKFGDTQMPHVWDYADNVDTIAFLSKL